MAAATPIELFELLRQAISSTEDGNVYLCAACIVLQKESSVEQAYESLLACVVQLLERQSAASSTCTCEICGVGDGGGVSGGEGEGEGVRGRRVWQLCCEAAKFGVRNSQTLLGFVCACRHFQDCCCQLVLAALTVGCSCGFLREGKNLSHFLTHVYMQFWSSQIEQFAKKANSINMCIESSATDVWFSCIKHAALLHVLQQMHSVLNSKLGQYTCTGSTGLSNETGTTLTTTCKQFLCEETSNPLAVRLARALPRVLHSMYQKWWKTDEEVLKNQKEVPAVNGEGVGLVLKSGHQLSVSLILVSTVLVPWTGTGTVLECCLESILRLSNLHFANLSEVVHSVPELLSVKLWYVIINSAICLHSMLLHLQSILNPTKNYSSLFSQLSLTITKFTDTLTNHTISYHTHLLRYSLLHDTESNNWSDTKPFLEGERCSLTIQMWHYHLRGLHDDLWRVGGGGIRCGEVMVKILREVLSDSVFFLEKRYSSISPTYSRTEQFKADILAVLVGVEFFLPCITSPSSSPHSLTALTSSCLSLVHTLSVVTSPLSHLHTSLSSTPPLLLTHTHSSSALCHSWMEYLDLTHFGILATSNQNTDDLIRNFQNFLSLPYPSWNLLLKILLAKGNPSLPSVLVTMVMHQQEKGEEPGSLHMLDHICRILSHCICQPRALGELVLHTWQDVAKEKGCSAIHCLKHNFQDQHCSKWLLHLLKETLQQCVTTWMMKTAWDILEVDSDQMTTTSGVTMVTEHILSLLDNIDHALSQLPSPVTLALSELLGKTALNGGASIGELLGTCLPSWLTAPPPSLPPAILSHLSFSLSLISWTLNGPDISLINPISAFPPSIQKDLKRGAPLIKQRLESLGTSLSNPSSIPEYDVELGHDIVANMLHNHYEAQESLHYLYNWLQVRKDYIIRLLQSPSTDQSESTPLLTPLKPAFNPLVVGMSLGNGVFDHKWLLEIQLPWDDLLKFSLPHLTQDKVIKLVRNRFEFQPNAQLEGSEPDLIHNINSILNQLPP